MNCYKPELYRSDLDLFLHSCEKMLQVYDLSVSVLQLSQHIHIYIAESLPEVKQIIYGDLN